MKLFQYAYEEDFGQSYTYQFLVFEKFILLELTFGTTDYPSTFELIMYINLNSWIDLSINLWKYCFDITLGKTIHSS